VIELSHPKSRLVHDVLAFGNRFILAGGWRGLIQMNRTMAEFRIALHLIPKAVLQRRDFCASKRHDSMFWSGCKTLLAA
jgi:hypothetical protein